MQPSFKKSKLLEKPKLFILGDGGFARELKTYFEKYRQRFDIILVPKEDISEYQSQVLANPSNCMTILGSGKCDIKAKMIKEITGTVINFHHPNSTVYPDRKNLGIGSVIAPGAVIAPNASIGKHVLVNYNATIGHDTKIGDLSVVSPNAAIGGNCQIGKQVYIGAGATIKEGTIIADNTIIGMGAAVIEDIIVSNGTYVGVPAKFKFKKVIP